MNNDNFNIKHKPYDFPSKLQEAKSIKELKEVVKQKKEKEGLSFNDYTRIVWNGLMTFLQNILKGKDITPDYGKIFWVIAGLLLLLILIKVL